MPPTVEPSPLPPASSEPSGRWSPYARRGHSGPTVPGPPAGPGSSAPTGASPAAALTPDDLARLSPPRLRRRPLLIALGVLLIVVGAIVAWYVVTILKDTVQVVAAVQTIPRGSVIERTDLTTVEIRPDPLLQTLPADRLDSLVGQRAAADIPAGVIVAPDAVTDKLPPASGQALVGVALNVNQMPATPPRHGQPITLVTIPGKDTGTSTTPPAEIAAVVLDYTATGEQGMLVLDVLVPKGQAATVAGLAASSQLAAYWDAE